MSEFSTLWDDCEKIKQINAEIKKIGSGKGHSSQRSKKEKEQLDTLRRSLSNLKGQQTKLKPKRKKGTQIDLFLPEDLRQVAVEKAQELEDAVKAFSLENQRTPKQKLKAQIKTLKWELIEATLRARGEEEKVNKVAKLRNDNHQPFFLWKLEFYEVFKTHGGFDVVIGNPPYVQLQKKEKISTELQKAYQDEGYETFEKTGDIYALFYELGLSISKSKTGLLNLITSNSWMCANYGVSLRRYFSWYQGIEIINFSGFRVFDNATVDANILTLQNQVSTDSFNACQIGEDYCPKDHLRHYVLKNQGEFSSNGDESWFIGSAKKMALKAKVERLGVSIKEWDLKINRGVLTGFNEAFIIDQDDYDELVAIDSKNDEIIKPVLRGKDIQRFSSTWAGKYLICSHNGYKNESEEKISPINIDEYPEIRKYLENVEQERVEGKYGKKAQNARGLFKREDQGITPYNLRNCAYYEDFEKEKVVWIELVDQGRFSIVREGLYCEATTFIMSHSSPRLITGILNSSLINWYFDKICAESGVGTNRWKKIYVEKIPLIEPNLQTKSRIEKIVNDILDLSKNEYYNPAKPPVEQLELEAEIDKHVYELYELTPDEIAIIEASVNKETVAKPQKKVVKVQKDWRDTAFTLVSATREKITPDFYKTAIWPELIRQFGDKVEFSTFRKAYWLLMKPSELEKEGSKYAPEISKTWWQARENQLEADDFFDMLKGSSKLGNIKLWEENGVQYISWIKKDQDECPYPSVVDDARIALLAADLWEDQVTEAEVIQIAKIFKQLKTA